MISFTSDKLVLMIYEILYGVGVRIVLLVESRAVHSCLGLVELARHYAVFVHLVLDLGSHHINLRRYWNVSLPTLKLMKLFQVLLIIMIVDA